VQYLAPLICLFLCAASVQASSPYAGQYLVVWKAYRPTSPDAKLEAGADVTITDDGTLTGRGTSFGDAFITLTGKVRDSGEAAITETDAGRIATYVIVSRYTAHFDGRDRFSVEYPDGQVIIGVRIDREKSAAGFYHAQTGSDDQAYIFVERRGAVRAVVFNAGNARTELSGKVTGDSFQAASPGGAELAGRFVGQKISGRYLNGQGGDSLFKGARY
jgi:hypothetical protein